MKLLLLLFIVICIATEGSVSYQKESISQDRNQTAHVMFISLAIRSHATPLLRIAKEMVHRGYRVSFATHDSGYEWVEETGAKFLSAGSFPISADELRLKLKKITKDPSNFRGILSMFNEVYLPAGQPLYNSLLPLLLVDPPDTVVMDISTIGAQDLVHKLNIPHVINSPSLMFDLEGSPSYVPAWGTGFSIKMSLWNRCMNILFPRLLSVALTPPFMHLNKVRWELQLEPFRSQHDIYRDSRIILNTAFGMEYSRYLSPLVDMVGPILPREYTSSLSSSSSENENEKSSPSAIQRWLEGGKESSSVIYINFGFMPYIEPWQTEAIVEGLTMRQGDPQFRVLWILPNDQRTSLPKSLPPYFRIKTSGSFPYLKVLSHKSVKVVLSHCGMASAQEALYFLKPVLCLPFFVDQPDVASRIVDSGAGLTLDKTRFSSEEVREKVLGLYRNASYSSAASHVGKVLRRSGGMSKAIEIIESGMRFGFDHLKTIDTMLPWHKTVMLDVWAVYAAVICVLAIFVRLIWIFSYLLLIRSFNAISKYIPPSNEETSISRALDTALGGFPPSEDKSKL